MRRRQVEQLRQQTLKEQLEKWRDQIATEVKPKQRGRPRGNIQRTTGKHS